MALGRTGGRTPARRGSIASSGGASSRRARPGAESKDTLLADGLGYFSLGLGLAELFVPNRVAKLIGARERPLLFRVLGLREIAAGMGIFAGSRVGGLWSRVVGDAMDLALLGIAATSKDSNVVRLATATTAVLGVTALDVLGAARMGEGVRSIKVVKTIAINRSPAECFRFWRELENLPRFMQHVEEIRALDGRRSHWVVRGPAGRTVEWDAEIVREEPDRLIAWESRGGDVETKGHVEFAPFPGKDGTLLRVSLEYAPPTGALGAFVAKLFGEEPEGQLEDDLRRFKQVLECGEIPTTVGQPSGRRDLVHRSLARLFTGERAA